MDTLFFIAAKLAWAFCKPATWFLLLATGTVVALLKGARKPALWCSGILLALILLVGMVPVGTLLLRPLEARYPANPPLDEVAGIVILGGGGIGTLSGIWDQPQVNEGGDRYLASLNLARRFPDAPVLFTGGIGSLHQGGPAEADVAEAIFLSSGLEIERLFLERTSRNTAENARNALTLRDPNAAGAWVLVTSAFHMPRSIETFCTAGWTNLVPWPTDYRGEDLLTGIGWNLAENLGTLETGLKENVGRLAYRLTGRADQDALTGCLSSTN